MKPLILDYKETRLESDSVLNYEYDVISSMNIVYINGEKKLYINLEATDIECMTKTKVHRENDDNHFLLELATKTEVRKERDDARDAFLELSTKTFTTREREDPDTSYYQ